MPKLPLAEEEPAGSSLSEPNPPEENAEATTDRPALLPDQRPTYWLWILCLLGVDYFSTLSYQPSITVEVAGALGPIATVLVVAVTLFAVLPLYLYIAKRSPHGEGSIALLERLLGGWVGKTLVLILLGFAATDFVMLKSISLADAAEHVVHNAFVAEAQPFQAVADFLGDVIRGRAGDEAAAYVNREVIVSILLGAVSLFFWFQMRRGFNQKVIALSVPLVGLYLLLSGIVIVSGLWHLHDHPALVARWQEEVQRQAAAGPLAGWLGMGPAALSLLSVMVLPQLALGFSGFEMSLILMPQVRGHKGDTLNYPRGRVRNTYKILVLAALVMSAYLLGAATVATLLVPAGEYRAGGLASGRALAYLAHGGTLVDGGSAAALNPLFGPWFGTLFDLVTVLILCFAGTSVMTALAVLLPRFLLRFGMELKWASRWGLMFVYFALVNLAVTVLFKASVADERGAYATGVLALIFSAAVVALIHWRQQGVVRRRFWNLPWRFALTASLFLVLLAAVVLETPSGLMISSCFISVILGSSVVSRALRTDELRTVGFEFADPASQELWDRLRVTDFPVLVPHRPGRHHRREKELVIRQDHQLDPNREIVFLEIEVDDPSNFYQRLLIKVYPEERNFVIRVTRCASVSHAIAAIALEMSRHCERPPGLHFGWSEMDLLAASWSYLAFGEGNVPWKVRELILQAEPDAAKRPRVVIG